jgi:4-hydroxymandelate oxidase
MPKRTSRAKPKPAARVASTGGVLGDDPSAIRLVKRNSKTKGSAAPANIPPASLTEYEILAHQRFTRAAWEYINSGSADENTMRWNVEALTRMRLKPNVMVDVSKIDMRTKLFGHEMPHPIMVAPTSSHFLAHCDGEMATARGAGAAGAIMVASTLSNCGIHEIVRAATQPIWFQLYADDDREKTKALIHRAEAVGCKALCITVDLPWIYARNREAHIIHEVPQLPFPNINFTGGPASTGLKTWRYRNLNWADIEWIQSFCKLPVLLKGILNPDDADRAAQAGASGIIVSNHGGRSLDTVPASIDALPAVAAKIAGQIPILMDGGIRRGADVLKALANGATAILLGRSILYGLGIGGAEGVQRVIEILRTEFEAAMALTGRTSIAAIDRSVIW